MLTTPQGCSHLRLSQIIGQNGLLPVSRSTFYKLIQDGEIPKPIKLGSYGTGYNADDIQTIIFEIFVADASDDGGAQ